MVTEARPAVLLLEPQRLGKLSGMHGRGADIARFAGFHHLVQRFERLFNRGWYSPSGGSAAGRHSPSRDGAGCRRWSAGSAPGKVLPPDRRPGDTPWWRQPPRHADKVGAGRGQRSLRCCRRSSLFAVSKKLMPPSMACWISGRLLSPGSVQACLPRSGSPKVMQPRQSRETRKAVSPRGYSA